MNVEAVTVGLSAATQGCAAVVLEQTLTGVCEQQRVTRVRAAGVHATGVPDEALDLLLSASGRTRSQVTCYTTGDADQVTMNGTPLERVDHHLAHACAAFLSSPFTSATIVVCDHDEPKVSVWRGDGAAVTRVEWPWSGPGFADVYSACASLFGFAAPGAAQRFEALARIAPDSRNACVASLVGGDGARLRVAPDWRARMEGLAAGRKPGIGTESTAPLAAAFQARIGELFLEFLASVAQAAPSESLCLGGSLFYHSSINTLVKQAGLFQNVFVPVDPGNPGVAAGAALHVSGSGPSRLSPFLGPGYSPDEIKGTLDNCKLQYGWESDEGVIAAAVKALLGGALVGWVEGRMEWGARALGGRSILANPFFPFALENLNGYLKRREPWRGYAVSVPGESVHALFKGPGDAPHMECDFRPHEPARFKHLLPAPSASIRVHTVDERSPSRFRRLLEAFGEATGTPCLVNTSFNGFHEPIVCSPRDAVRVFYGTGVDVLALEQFILAK